ncbi:hypothetical protein, partial [Staphylococcus aureus]|uniref:hypothetical protein n=1 Tax=Staphylococcus aureus TaxID=1280 RepID=UPI001556925F
MTYQSAKIFIVQKVIEHFKNESKKDKNDTNYRPVLNQYFGELYLIYQKNVNVCTIPFKLKK